MTTKSFRADLSTKEEKEFPELFEKVKEEFENETKYCKNLWKNSDIHIFLMLKERELPPYINELSKHSDAMIVNMLYKIYEYFDCIDCLKQTNNPFVNKVTTLYHKARSNIIEKIENSAV